MRYVVFAKEACPYCVSARELLESRKEEHKIINFSPEQEEVLNEIKNACDWKTVPMIFCREGDNIQFIGGYTDLVKCMDHVEEG